MTQPEGTIYLFSVTLLGERTAPLIVAFTSPPTTDQILDGIAATSAHFDSDEMRLALGADLADFCEPRKLDTVLDACDKGKGKGWASAQKPSSDGKVLLVIQRVSLRSGYKEADEEKA